MLVKLIADGLVFVTAILGAYALIKFIPNKDKYQVYARILMAGLTAYLAAKIAGFFYQPETLRPFELMGVEAGASFLNNPGFPSDHALFVMAIALAVWAETRQKWLTVLMMALVVIVCIGRVLALVHTPLDVVAGVIVACIGGLWYLQRDHVVSRRKA